MRDVYTVDGQRTSAAAEDSSCAADDDSTSTPGGGAQESIVPTTGEARDVDSVRTIARRVWWTDLAVIAVAVTLSHLVRFGVDGLQWTAEAMPSEHLSIAVSYGVIGITITITWMAMLGIYGTRSRRVLGSGDLEFKRVFRASILLFGMLAIVCFALRIDLARGYVALAFPIGLLLLLGSRLVWRAWLRRAWASNLLVSRSVLVGSRASVDDLIGRLRTERSTGFLVVGAYLPDGALGDRLESGVAVLGDIDELTRDLAGDEIQTVIVTSSDALSSEQVRRVSWGLRPGRQHLIVAPALTDVGGPRIHVRPVAGLPLVHVETPRYQGPQATVKRMFDIAMAGALLVILSVPLLAVALAVRLTSRGPVLFAQERVGLNGRPFRMLKFRSMVSDAEARLGSLLEARDASGNEVLFKLKDDPRITGLGRWLRRFSIDELPQLFNVLGGSMSIVGPRPPLAREVERYEEHVRRRFLVKPGLTGLWQVSGRSNLSWEDSVRLDLYYVENWSFVSDLAIIARTARAVVARDGAY